MAGSNWINLMESSRLTNIGAGVKCVFISHQKKDAEAARELANYLLNAGVNVYFDEYDNDLRLSRQSGNAKGVTDSIRMGINSSTHMICIVSLDTLSSTWVPFEVGYGFDKTELGVITLKGVPKHKLPDYVKTAKFIIRDIWDVNHSLISKFVGISNERLLESRRIKLFSDMSHPLEQYMDRIIHES